MVSDTRAEPLFASPQAICCAISRVALASTSRLVQDFDLATAETQIRQVSCLKQPGHSTYDQRAHKNLVPVPTSRAEAGQHPRTQLCEMTGPSLTHHIFATQIFSSA